MGGLRYTTGDPDSPPARVGISIGDTPRVASWRDRRADVAAPSQDRAGARAGRRRLALESVFNVMESLVPEYDLLGQVRTRTGGALPGITPRTLPDEGRRLRRDRGQQRPDLQPLDECDRPAGSGRGSGPAQQRRSHSSGRHARRAITDWSKGHTIDGSLAALDAADVPAGRIYSVADIVADPHYAARDMILPTELPGGTHREDAGHRAEALRDARACNWPGPRWATHRRRSRPTSAATPIHRQPAPRRSGAMMPRHRHPDRPGGRSARRLPDRARPGSRPADKSPYQRALGGGLQPHRGLLLRIAEGRAGRCATPRKSSPGSCGGPARSTWRCAQPKGAERALAARVDELNLVPRRARRTTAPT